ncbi:uncharacterized protein LOC131845112 [Achroia grisella]|uniref:uncharacterized protein LOC131845112 n=1 Tax=Achroia grisella TaxID=688607 RepID=UPI0027D2F6A9|nr:uncharacterized protein LOC131845112 [Achroia grisella]
MKMRAIMLLAVCLTSGIADSISKQKLSADNKQPLSETKPRETKHSNEALLNNVEPEQKKDVITINSAANMNDDNGEYSDSNVQIIIESIDSPAEEMPSKSESVFINNEIALNSDNYRDTYIDSDPNEIMETAAGFVPIPIFRKRQNARRRFATRRHFKRNPYPYTYKRLYYYYPYYGFYYPSSLKYY